MINLIGICGSRIKEGNMEALLEDALSHAGRHQDVEAEAISLAGKEINGCNHCNWCIKKQSDERPCVQDDDMGPIYPKLLHADGIILASPAHFGRLSGILANMIDRTRAFVHGNVFRHPLKNKIGGAMAIAFFRGAGIETTLSSIDLFFLTHQMIVATGGLYQLGAGALSSPDGMGKFKKEPRHIVLEDEYGVLSTRMLADRMVELARIIEAGRKALKKAS
jgi:multimeric flavodoxin WrbA